MNPDELPGFVGSLGADYFRGPRIGVWGWEVNAIPGRWSCAFPLVDEIWVYSRFVAENIGAVAPIPVTALPPPVSAPEPATPVRLGVPDGFLFLFIFDYLSTIQRKNPTGLDRGLPPCVRGRRGRSPAYQDDQRAASPAA